MLRLWYTRGQKVKVSIMSSAATLPPTQTQPIDQAIIQLQLQHYTHISELRQYK